MTQKTYTPSELTLVIKSFERQASILFKVILLLALTNVLFMYLYFTCPQNVSINLAQDKTIHSDQKVSR